MLAHCTVTGKEAMAARLAARITRDPGSSEVMQAMVGGIGGPDVVPC